MKTKKLLHNIFVLTILLGFAGFSPVVAQPNCTNHTGGNGNGMVTFNVKNNSAAAITVTEVSSQLFTPSTASLTWTLLYNDTTVNSGGGTWSQGTVGVGQNGWQQGGTNRLSLAATATN